MELVRGEVVLCEFGFSDGLGVKKRPVLVFKDNLPFDDFVGIPISSQPIRHQDELSLQKTEFIEGSLPKISKLILRKTFVINKDVVMKSYGVVSPTKLEAISKGFCEYFECT